MRRLILKWLFGTDNVQAYMKLLADNMKHHEECCDLIAKHIKTLESQKEDLDNVRKLIKICENHGINVDEEIKYIKL